MPAYKGKEESVHLALLPVVSDEWKDKELGQRWKKIIEVRTEVTKVLEEARAKKIIGHSLNASVKISAQNDLFDLLAGYLEELKTIFITSDVTLIKNGKHEGASQSHEIEGLYISAEPAPGKKCERCWIYDMSVGSDVNEPGICGRCNKVLKQIANLKQGEIE
jgi:isoleucyl-tRNA synthetase